MPTDNLKTTWFGEIPETMDWVTPAYERLVADVGHPDALDDFAAHVVQAAGEALQRQMLDHYNTLDLGFESIPEELRDRPNLDRRHYNILAVCLLSRWAAEFGEGY